MGGGRWGPEGQWGEERGSKGKPEAGGETGRLMMGELQGKKKTLRVRKEFRKPTWCSETEEKSVPGPHLAHRCGELGPEGNGWEKGSWGMEM